MTKEELGPLLKEMRTQAGISEARMAVEQDVTVKTIQNWEAGRTKPIRGALLIYQSVCKRTIPGLPKPLTWWESPTLPNDPNQLSLVWAKAS